MGIPYYLLARATSLFVRAFFETTFVLFKILHTTPLKIRVIKLRVYVGKTENHRGTTSLFTRTFLRLAEKTTSKQPDRSEMIRGLTYINEVYEKRYLSQIDSVCVEHSASTFVEIIRSHGLPESLKTIILVELKN